MDKERWRQLKHGAIKPASEEEKNALREWRKDQELSRTFYASEIREAKSTRDRKEGTMCNYRKGG